MPRASNSAKRQQGATNVRDTRHENGLVGPGKRVLKRKSQNQLDNGPNPAAEYGVAPPLPPNATSSNASAQHLDDVPPEHRTTESLRRASLGTYSESSSTDSLPVPSAIVISEENHRHIDVNDAKNTSVHRDPGPLEFAFTVLRSCPLSDTLAILIILMQVSPAALATIYMLFTLLTFVPPVTTSSGLSIADIFDGNQGTPSLTTLVCMDVIMLAIWLFLWAPIQQFILDLAQVVISLTLGGGGSSRPKNIFLCVLIVGVRQWAYHARWSSVSKISSFFGTHRFFGPMSDGPVSSTMRAFEKKGPYGWVRSILAIHILTQGMVRYIREWYLRRERRDMQLQTQLDPEAGKSAATFSNEGSSDAALMAADSDAHLQTTVTTKKKRKQSAQVRIRQPLWAALASTKIVMVKEYELSHAASESAGSNATDIHNLGNAPFNTQPEHVWICYVGCDEVCFNTSHFPDPAPPDDSEDEDKQGIDTTKPFYVRVNNAVWQATRISPIDAGEEEKHEGTRWTGDIYGLTPLSNYEFEFVSTRTGKVIFSTSVRTVQAKSKDLEAAKNQSNQPSRARHDSPATTLRTSIAAAEAKLADEKARLKSARKDNSRKLNAAKKEIEKLTAAVQSAGGDDEKLRQKVAQNKIQLKRAEDAIASLDIGLQELDSIPEELRERHKQKRKEYAEKRAKYEEARTSFKSFKADIERELKASEEENLALRAKRNKIAARIAKVEKEHSRITDANSQGMDEAERRRQQSALLESEMERAEKAMMDKINHVRALNSAKQAQVTEMANHMQEYLATFQEDPIYDQNAPITGPQPQYTAPAAQWGHQATPGQYNIQAIWPATSMPAQAPALLPSAQLSTFGSPMQSVAATPPPHRSRGRSSSMLSNVSGFTESTDDAQANRDVTGATMSAASGHVHSHSALGRDTPVSTTLHGPPGFNMTRQRGEGDSVSGSGSGSGTGSASVIDSASASGSGSGSGSGRSSVRSGSGSCDSPKEPGSPM